MEYEIDPDESASMAVVRAVSNYTDTPPAELEPLYDVVDPEALDALVCGLEPGSRRGREIRFRYDDVDVTVTPTHVYLNGSSATRDR